MRKQKTSANKMYNEGKITLDYFKYPGLGYQMQIFRNSDLSDYEQLATKLNHIRPVMMHGLGLKPHNIGSKTFLQDFDVYYAKK